MSAAQKEAPQLRLRETRMEDATMKTLKELIQEERDAVATMIAMRDNYLAAQNNLDAATRNLANARFALDMALKKSADATTK